MMFDKIIYSVFAAAAIGALAACTSSPETEELQSAQVQFRASEISRSSLTTIETIKESPFAVYGDMVSTSNASATPTVVFNGTEVKYTDGAWSYNDPQYWFPGQTYSFVAIHPATPANIDGTPNYENNKLSFQYTYPESYGNAQDILVAAHRRKYTPGNPHAVAFEFKHIFARINFVAKVDPTVQGEFVIDRMSLHNVSNSATFTVAPSPITDGNETYDFSGEWTAHNEANATLFDITPNVTVNTTENTVIFKADDPLMIIPQSVNNRVEVSLTYHRAVDSPNPITVTANLFSVAIAAHNGEWQAGKSYNYTFTLGDSEYIVFSEASAQDWNEAEGANFIIAD